MIAEVELCPALGEMSLSQAESHRRIDAIEAKMLEEPQVECPVVSSFVPGFYVRTTTMPANSLITSRIHNTDHPFFIEYGTVTVTTPENGLETLVGPVWGMTKAGTRRVLFNHTEVKWSTIHATDKTTVDEVAADIILKREDLQLPTEESLCLG